MNSLALSIGGLSISVTAEQGLPLDATGATRLFIADPAGEPHCRLVARFDDPGSTAGTPAFESGGVWRLFRTGGGRLQFDFHSSASGESPYKRAELEPDFSRGEVQLSARLHEGAQSIYPLEYPLDEILVTNLLARHGGIELHASGIVDEDGRGWLFSAQSGGGKTTMSRLWLETNRARILSDDRIIIRLVDGEVRMFGTPWHGEAELAHASSAPVHGIYLLAHGEWDEWMPIESHASATAELLTRSFVPLWSGHAMDAAIGFLGEVIDRIPVHHLRFRPTTEIVARLRASRE